jgi:hypothetical protein
VCTERPRECPLLAQSRHGLVHRTCPLLGVKRTCPQTKITTRSTFRRARPAILHRVHRYPDGS